jgi:hypothetical protein
MIIKEYFKVSIQWARDLVLDLVLIYSRRDTSPGGGT